MLKCWQMIIFALVVLVVSASMGWFLEYRERLQLEEEESEDALERTALEEKLEVLTDDYDGLKDQRDKLEERCKENSKRVAIADERIEELEKQLKEAQGKGVELGVYAKKIHSAGFKQPHRFVLRSFGNHKPVCTSEHYTNKGDMNDTLGLFPGIKIVEAD